MLNRLEELGLAQFLPKSWRKPKEEEFPSRKIVLGKINHQFPNNSIRTSKYTLWSFIPINLGVQFSNLTNVYFLFISIIQFIPGASPIGNATTIIPLSFFILIAMYQEAYYDYLRRQMDREENHRTVAVLSRDGPEENFGSEIHLNSMGSTWELKPWWELQVGDIVRVDENQWIPADLVLLASGRPDGACYLETAALDGESNLKKLQGVKAVQEQVSTDNNFSRLKGYVDVEEPTLDLYSVEGNLHLEGVAQFPLNIGQIMLRGSILRNTPCAYGVIVYSGEQTKIRLNASRNNKAKIPTINYTVNRAVIAAFLLLLSLASLATGLHSYWETQNEPGAWYLYKAKGNAKSTTLTFLGFILLLNNIVPISLFFNLEFCKPLQAFFIMQDRAMFHEPTNTPAHFHTAVLNDDLGMIEYIFSDKTGTLTENAMHFRRLYAFGINYTQNRRHSLLAAAQETHLQTKAIRPVSSTDLTQALQGTPNLALTFLGISLCHTAYPDIDNNTGKLTYQATSPDELALIHAAKDMGFVLIDRDSQGMTLEISTSDLGSQKLHFDVLDTIEFTSDRKRMSIVIKLPDFDRVVVFSKGADSTMLPLLSPDQPSSAIQEAKDCMYSYSCQGLRTLVLAYKFLSASDYQLWKTHYDQASQSLGSERQQKMSRIAAELEKNFLLLGATGLEDRLQQGVPESIATLRKAGIKVWVLTGDKRETAINIGQSCSLISPNDPLVILDIAEDELYEQIASAIQSWVDGSSVVIDGATFDYLETRGGAELELFFDLAVKADTVILCRSSPSQKATVVRLMRSRVPSKVTLAIGDGGNDVAMIQEAHVGIGISGNEGLMAARSSDYSIAQFRFLVPLLLVHGQWNYFRSCRLILLTFYKVMTFYFSQYLYQYFTAFTGTSWYENWNFSFYNASFTMFPVLVVGLFEKNYPREHLLANPELYRASGPMRTHFNVPLYLGTIVTSFIHALLIAGPHFFSVVWTNPTQADAYPPSGSQMYFMGISVYWTTVVVVTIWISFLSTRFCTLVHVFFAALSVIIYFLTQVVFSAAYSPTYPLPVRGSILPGFGSPQLWLPFFFSVAAIICYKCLARLIDIETDSPLPHLRVVSTWCSRLWRTCTRGTSSSKPLPSTATSLPI